MFYHISTIKAIARDKSRYRKSRKEQKIKYDDNNIIQEKRTAKLLSDTISCIVQIFPDRRLQKTQHLNCGI